MCVYVYVCMCAYIYVCVYVYIYELIASTKVNNFNHHYESPNFICIVKIFSFSYTL